jgi:hypothetical protein
MRTMLTKVRSLHAENISCLYMSTEAQLRDDEDDKDEADVAMQLATMSQSSMASSSQPTAGPSHASVPTVHTSSTYRSDGLIPTSDLPIARPPNPRIPAPGDVLPPIVPDQLRPFFSLRVVEAHRYSGSLNVSYP